MADTGARVERLVNLTVTLLEARRPLTLDEIKRRTGYYAQGDTETARRMFERDKDALRGVGVPLRVATDPTSGHDGYVLERRDYELPDLDLDRDEVAALAVVLQLTGQADDRLAMSKLAARAPDPLAVTTPVDARLTLDTAPVEAVADALIERRVLRFTYRTATGDERARTVDPHGVVMRRGAWYVVGRDHDRDDMRSFRIDRIVGTTTTVGPAGAFSPRRDLDLAGRIAGPVDATAVDVDVAVAPELAWMAESQGARPTDERHGDWPVHRFVAADPTRLVPWLLGQGSDVVVLRPDEVRSEVVARLRATLAAVGDRRS